MTGARIEIEVQDAEVRAALGRLLALATDPRPALEEIGGQQRAHVDERFEGGFGPGRVPWKQSARARVQRGSTLVDSGRLRDSITFAATADGVQIGTAVAYAAIHQFGGEIRQNAYSRRVLFRTITRGPGRGQARFAKAGSRGKNRFERPVTYAERVIRMPARPFLGIDDTDRAAVDRILRAHIAAATSPGAADGRASGRVGGGTPA